MFLELPAEQQDSETHVSEMGVAETPSQNGQQSSEIHVLNLQETGDAEISSQNGNPLDAGGDEHTPNQVAAILMDVPDTSNINDFENTENGKSYSSYLGAAFLAAGRKPVSTYGKQSTQASSPTEEPSDQNVNETEGISVELLGSQIGTVLGTIVSELLNSTFRKPEEALSAEEVAVLIERTMKELLKPVLKCKCNTFVEGFVHSFRSMLFITKCIEETYASKPRIGMSQVINSQNSPPEENLQPALTDNNCAVTIKSKVHTSFGSLNQEASECFLNQYSGTHMFETLQRVSGNCLENDLDLSTVTDRKGEVKDCELLKDKRKHSGQCPCPSDDQTMTVTDTSEPSNEIRAEVRDCGLFKDVDGKQKCSKKCLYDDHKFMPDEESSLKADISGTCLENDLDLSTVTDRKGEVKDCKLLKDKRKHSGQCPCPSDDQTTTVTDTSEHSNEIRAEVRDCGLFKDVDGKQKCSKQCLYDDHKVMPGEESSLKADISSLDDIVDLVSTDDIVERLEKLEIGNYLAVDKQVRLLVLAENSAKGLASLPSQKCIVENSYCAPTVCNFQQQFLNILEKSVNAQERSNQIQSLELFQKLKQLSLKEEHLHVASETNSLMKKSINLNKTRFQFKMQDTEDRKLIEGYAALSRTFAAGLTEGLIVMLVMLLYGATTYSYHKISKHVLVCHPVHKKSSRFSWIGVDKLFPSFETLTGPFYALFCRTFVMSRMIFGLAVIAFVASMLLRYTINTSNQTVPPAIILIVLGVICGFAGKISVESLGGSGKHWLFIWEVFCLVHAFASWFTPSLFHLLNDPSNRPQKSWFFQRSRQNIFCLILNFFIPVMAGLVPFAPLTEAIPRLLMDMCALVTRSASVRP